jgi:TPR repeat protein
MLGNECTSGARKAEKAQFMEPKAKLGLARMYDRGLGAGKDPARAFATYSDLAMKGSDDAQRHCAEK